MPWLSEAFFLAKEDELYKEAQKSGKVSAEEVTTMGKGGGNVTKSAGNIISIAGKFGLRKEEMPILIKTAKKWFNKSVDDVGHKYEQLVPGYSTKEEIMRAVICMFDSGYTLPQGREVMNYYYPLQFGIEGIKNICKEKQDQAAGYPEMNRLYFYKAVYIMLEGLQTWIMNYVKEARLMASLEDDPAQKKNILSWPVGWNGFHKTDPGHFTMLFNWFGYFMLLFLMKMQFQGYHRVVWGRFFILSGNMIWTQEFLQKKSP